MTSKAMNFASQFMQLGENAHNSQYCPFLNTSISRLVE